MALLNYGVASGAVRKFEDIAADFPSKGIPITQDTYVLVKDVAAGTTVTLYVTGDSWDDIEADTAEWATVSVISAGDSAEFVMEHAPTGIKLVASGAGNVAWVKS